MPVGRLICFESDRGDFGSDDPIHLLVSLGRYAVRISSNASAKAHLKNGADVFTVSTKLFATEHDRPSAYDLKNYFTGFRQTIIVMKIATPRVMIPPSPKTIRHSALAAVFEINPKVPLHDPVSGPSKIHRPGMASP